MNSVKSLQALKAAGLIVAAVVLGLMTVQGSYALWNAAVSAPPATVQAADFKVKIGEKLLSTGQTVALPAITLELGGQPNITPVVIAGAANVTGDSPFRSTTTVTVNPAAAPLVVRVATTTVNGTCPQAAAEYKTSAVAPAQKTDVGTTFCFQTALLAGTTNQQLGGLETKITATVKVDQVPPE
ncbi:hypothetical protein J2M53_12905 [Arthrobacter sp. zg-ZUI100]|uniref:hypothetical protein n=1 Tax=Arthrobacter jiangjiafuii TaxID=2817475 RepID=UPI001AEE998D|nr:hypothetical protein [Arthrobacter jiangjiafuii]MBP3037143.1 hypothetical protein [Arthrobacter jiangjiafuii]